MGKIVKDIYDAQEFLSELLKVSGLSTIVLGKAASWMRHKFEKYSYGYIKPGFQEQDIPIVNKALRTTARMCLRSKVVVLPESKREHFNARVQEKLVELRKVVNINYMIEHYTSINKNTFARKIQQGLNKNGKPCYFTREDVEQINKGLDSMAELLNSIELILEKEPQGNTMVMYENRLKRIIMAALDCKIKGLKITTREDMQGPSDVTWWSYVSDEWQSDIPENWKVLRCDFKNKRVRLTADENSILEKEVKII